MEKITLKYDDEGNVLVDITGLIYLIHTEQLAIGANVYMVEEEDQVTEYQLIEEERFDGLTGRSLVLCDETADTYYLEMNTYSLTASFFIHGDDVTLSTEKETVKTTFTAIKPEQAVALMAKGKPAYLKTKDDEYLEKGKSNTFTAEELMSGDWFVKNEPLVAPQPDQKESTPAKKTIPPQQADKAAIEKTDTMLMKYLGMSATAYYKMMNEIEREEELDEEFDDVIANLPLSVCHEVIREIYNMGYIDFTPMDGDNSLGVDYMFEVLDDDFDYLENDGDDWFGSDYE